MIDPVMMFFIGINIGMIITGVLVGSITYHGERL